MILLCSVGRDDLADDILRTMKAAGYEVRASAPFAPHRASRFVKGEPVAAVTCGIGGGPAWPGGGLRPGSSTGLDDAA